MSATARRTGMTRDEFFAWAQRRQDDTRYEFDGEAPVAITGGTYNHNRIALNVHAALRDRLRGTGCTYAGIDAGVATLGERVRYPDALVSCAPVPGDARLIPHVVAVFEVISPSTARSDRVVKLREYRAVPTLRRYVLVESSAAAVTVLARTTADGDWTATGLGIEDTLELPEAGIAVPVSAIYEDIVFEELGAD